MFNRKNWPLLLVVVLLVSSLAACTSGGATVPDREVEISVDEAMMAQEMGMAGMMMGSVEWTESQFSSLLSVLIEQNGAENNPIDSVTAWFEPDMMYLRVQMVDGTMPMGDTLDLAGSVSVENNFVVVDLQSASAGPFTVGGSILGPISAHINKALQDPSLGVAVGVEMGEGTIMVELAQ